MKTYKLLAATIAVMMILIPSAMAAGDVTILKSGPGNISITSPAEVHGNVVSCKNGESVSLRLIPSDGYRVGSVTINGEYQLIDQNGEAAIDITPDGDTEVAVYFEKIPTPVPSGPPISIGDIKTDIQTETPTVTPAQSPNNSGIGSVGEDEQETGFSLPSWIHDAIPFVVCFIVAIPILRYVLRKRKQMVDRIS